MATVDLQAFIPNSPGPATQALVTPTYSGGVVSGSQKLAQAFAIILMTPLGSIPYLPLRGSKFVPLLQQGMASEADVLTAFAAAQIDVSRFFASIQPATTTPANEAFARATLNQILVTTAGAFIQVTVYNKTGNPTNLMLPLDFSI